MFVVKKCICKASIRVRIRDNMVLEMLNENRPAVKFYIILEVNRISGKDQV